MNTTQLFAEQKVPLAPGVTLSGLVGDQLMVTHLLFDAGAVGAVHTHQHEQITLVLSGAVTITVGEERKRLEAGDAVAIPGDTPHGVIAHSASAVLDIFTPVRADLVAKLAG